MSLKITSGTSLFKLWNLFFKKVNLCYGYFNSDKGNDALIDYLNLEWRTDTPIDLKKYKPRSTETHNTNSNQFVFPNGNRRNIF